jgi:excisionase family DNA binding protein
MPNNHNNNSLSVSQTARRLGFTLKYVYDLIHSGRIEARKVGRQWRVSKEAVEQRAKTIHAA